MSEFKRTDEAGAISCVHPAAVNVRRREIGRTGINAPHKFAVLKAEQVYRSVVGGKRTNLF